MYLVAILLPWLSFLLRGKVLKGILCLLLQITVIGWLFAAIWAVLDINKGYADKRNEKLVKAVQQRNAV